METLNAQVNARGWRRMPAAELEDLIWTLRRRAVRQHLSASQWAELDCMRLRLARLLREASR
jgi:hypothetical protein